MVAGSTTLPFASNCLTEPLPAVSSSTPAVQIDDPFGLTATLFVWIALIEELPSDGLTVLFAITWRVYVSALSSTLNV